VDVRLTELLVCPRCGPGYGLILGADRAEARRVLDGWLACVGCLGRYPVRAGFADLRWPPGGEEGAGGVPRPGSAEESLRLAAGLGVTEGWGFVLVAGAWARLAPGLAALVAGLEVVAADPALAGWREEPGVSRIAVGPGLPFRDGVFRGVALAGGGAEEAGEAVRVLAPGGRLVLEGPAAAARVAELGLELLVAGGGAVVARKR